MPCENCFWLCALEFLQMGDVFHSEILTCVNKFKDQYNCVIEAIVDAAGKVSVWSSL